MRTIRRPSRAQVRRALDAWRLLARPPDTGKTNPFGVASGEGAEGEAEGTDASEIAPSDSRYLSAERELQFADSYSRADAIMAVIEYGHPRAIELLGENWSTCDSYPREMRDILRTLPCPALAAMTPEEIAFLASMPARVTIYRGCYRHNRKGFSWTTDRAVAERFPFLNRYRHRDEQAILLIGVVQRKNILFAKLDRGESEIVPIPGKVKISEEMVLERGEP